MTRLRPDTRLRCWPPEWCLHHQAIDTIKWGKDEKRNPVLYYLFQVQDTTYYILSSFELKPGLEGIHMEFHVYQVQFKKHSIAPSGCSLVIVVEPGKLLPPAIYLVWCLKLLDSFQGQSNRQTFFNCDLYSSSILLALYPSLQSKKWQNQFHSMNTC